MAKFLGVLQSRKFWASVVGLLVAFGALNYSDSQQADLVGAILAVASAASYVISVAIEDAGRARGGQNLD